MKHYKQGLKDSTESPYSILGTEAVKHTQHLCTWVGRDYILWVALLWSINTEVTFSLISDSVSIMKTMLERKDKWSNEQLSLLMPVAKHDQTPTFPFSPHVEVCWDSCHLNFISLTGEQQCQVFPEYPKV